MSLVAFRFARMAIMATHPTTLASCVTKHAKHVLEVVAYNATLAKLRMAQTTICHMGQQSALIPVYQANTQT